MIIIIFGNISDYEENEIIGESSITAFNIEKIDTSLWTKVDKVLVNNEDIVTAGQELLNVSNDDATGKIYSTISGKLYIEDGKLGKSYIIYDLDNLGYELRVSEDKIKYLKIGQKVETKLTASNEIVYGNICYISQIPQDEQIKIKVKIDNSDKIKIGYTVKARILTDEPIDENIAIYDIKNSIPKIGKTTINYKTNGKEISYSSVEEMLANNDIIAMYEKTLEEQGIIIEELMEQIQELSEMVGNDTENGVESDYGDTNENSNADDSLDIEAVSQYWSGYWKEYWEAEYNKLVQDNNNSDIEGEE